MYTNSYKNTITVTLISGEEHGLIITWKIILSFILVAQLSVTVQHRHRTVKPGCWDLHWFRGNKFENLTINRFVKGDCRINSVKNRNITSPPGSCTIHEISFLKIFSFFFGAKFESKIFSSPPLWYSLNSQAVILNGVITCEFVWTNQAQNDSTWPVCKYVIQFWKHFCVTPNHSKTKLYLQS